MDPLITTNCDIQPTNKKFGEIYCNYMGVLSFHCVFCPTQLDHSDEFILHYMIHFRDVFEIKQESPEDSNLYEPDIGIAEHTDDDIKLEQSVLTTTPVISNEIKSEPDDNDASTDNSFSDMESTHQSKVKFIDPRKCGICGQTFVVRKLLKNHIRIHQAGPVPKHYECDVCGRRVNQKKNLLTHIRRRHGQKVKCKICGKLLRQHYMVTKWFIFTNHSTEESIVFQVAHVRRHNNERNFKCMLCDKGKNISETIFMQRSFRAFDLDD